MAKSPRQQALDEITRKLEAEYEQVQRQVSDFKYRHKKLVDEQTILKRKRAELHRLIKGIKENRLP